MIQKLITGLIFILILLLMNSAYAASLFVTDKINIDVYTEKQNAGAVVSRILVGSKVKVLAKEGGFSKISTKTQDVGWVSSKYLTKEKPYQLKYIQALAKYKVAQKDLDKANDQVGQMRTLKKQVAAAKTISNNLVAANKKIDQLEKLLDSAPQTQTTADPASAIKTSTSSLAYTPGDGEAQLRTALMSDFTYFHFGLIPITWVVAFLVLCIILGFYLGVKYLDKKISSKHGGIRFY